METLKNFRRPLGKTGLTISPLGLGTVKFGRNEGVKYPEEFQIPDERHLADLIAQAKELGINMLDTAPAYGSSEERLGRLLNKQRQDWIIVGKVGEEFHNGKSEYIFTSKHFEKSLHHSLKNLQTDYIDVLLIHSDGNDTDILNNNNLIEKMIGFKQRGLVRAIGASTKTVKGGIKTLDLMDVVMATYSPVAQEEKPVLDHAQNTGKGVLLKKALASGHLDKLGANPLQSAMDFAFSHPATHGLITGTINPLHLKENVQAALEALKSPDRLKFAEA